MTTVQSIIFYLMIFIGWVTNLHASNEHTLHLDMNFKPVSNAAFPVDDDGYVRFNVSVPDKGEAFFSRQNVIFKLPYKTNGKLQNYIVNANKPGLYPVSIPSDKPPGSFEHFWWNKMVPLRSIAERVLTPIIQFMIVRQWIISSQGKYLLDFQDGNFLHGIQGYALLDSSLRSGRDANEYLEIYYEVSPLQSHTTVLLLFGTGALLLKNVNIDYHSFDAWAAQHSYMYSGGTAQLVEVADKAIFTPLGEWLYPSGGLERRTKSRLFSQFLRGAGFYFVLDAFEQRTLDKVSGKPRYKYPFSVRKIMSKSVSEVQQLNEMIGSTLKNNSSPLLTEWILHGSLLALHGLDGSANSLEKVFIAEMERKLGGRAHNLIARRSYDQVMGEKQVTRSQSTPVTHLQPGSHWKDMSFRIFQDFVVGASLYKISTALSDNDLLTGRIGIGIGSSFMLKALGTCLIEPASAYFSDTMYDCLNNNFPALKHLFQRDLLVEIHHGDGFDESNTSPWHSNPVKDEL